MAQVIPLIMAGATAAGPMALISAGLGAVTSIMAGNFQAKVANNNATIAEQNATRVRQEAATQAQMQDIEASQEIGALLAQSSSSGLDVGVGSGALRRKSAGELAARDRGFTIYQGQVAGDAFKQEAANFRSEAKSAKIGGFLGAATSLFDLTGPNLLGDAAKTGKSGIRPKRNPIYTGAI